MEMRKMKNSQGFSGSSWALKQLFAIFFFLILYKKSLSWFFTYGWHSWFLLDWHVWIDLPNYCYYFFTKMFHIFYLYLSKYTTYNSWFFHFFFFLIKGWKCIASLSTLFSIVVLVSIWW
jgi:hypothetical protein